MAQDGVEPDTSFVRRHPIALAAAAVVALRILARVWVGPLSTINYDEGCYFTQGSLLARGFVPYRDFAMAHPPGVALFVAPFTWLGTPSTSLVLCRLAMALVGGANACLVGTIARSKASTSAALGAMAVYAVLPEVASSERQIMIEPLLNLCCLLVAWCWLSDQAGRSWPRRALQTGVLLGVALCCKSWAVLVIAPIAVTTTPGRRLPELGRVVAAAAGTALALLAPVLLLAPHQFLDQTIRFQLGRPTEGAPFADRLATIFGASSAGRALPATMVVLAAVAAAVLTRRLDRLTTYSLVWFAVLAASFLVAPTYTIQYNAHLGPAVALASVGAFQAVADRRSDAAVHRPALRLGAAGVVAVIVVGVALVAARGIRWMPAGRDPEGDWTTQVDAALASAAVPPGCVFAFEPAWLIPADRWAQPDRAGPLVSDSFGGALSEAVRTGDGDQAFLAPAAQAATQAAVDSCDTVLLGVTGRVQLGTEGMDRFERDFERVATTTPDGPDVWVRRT